jgi:hypothetical protein
MTTDTRFWSDGRIWMDTAHRGARAEASGSRILPIFAASSTRSSGAPPNAGERQLRRGVGGASELQVILRGMHPLQQKISLAPTGPRDAWQRPSFSCPPGSAGTLAVCKQKLGFASFRNSFVAETPVAGRRVASLSVVCPGDPCEQQRVDFLCRRRLSFSVGHNAHHRGPLPANGAQPTAQLVSGRAHLRACPAGAHASRAVILPGARGAHSLPNE